MTTPAQVALLGDYSPGVKAHRAIPIALELAGAAAGARVTFSWLPSAALVDELEPRLSPFHAFWCVPGSPYQNEDGVLRAIQWIREAGMAFLGTCGGFQHALIEYARNALHLASAAHAETNPLTECPLISPFACSLVGKRGRIRLTPGSQVAHIYHATEVEEAYHCNFGLNPQFQSRFSNGGLKITGVDENNEARVVELAGAAFFMGTLFQPELSALAERPRAHPLVVALVRAALR